MAASSQNRSPARERSARYRTCVGCRAQVPHDRVREELIRFVFAPSDDGGVTPLVDLNGSSFGRGAWVHARPSCLETAAQKGFSRSAKASVQTTPEQVLTAVVEAAQRRISGLMGIAQRSGKLAVGANAVATALRGSRACFVIVAQDAGAAARLTEVRAAGEAGLVMPWGSKEVLGAMLRRETVGVLAILDDGLAVVVRQALALAELGGTVDRGVAAAELDSSGEGTH